MSRRFLIAGLFLLSSIYCMAAGNYNELWKKGNAFYEQKQYDSAAWCYEQIAATRPHNAGLYYNLGNTYYKMNRIPLAVLNYERTLQIDPKNYDARDNLAIAQSRISNHIAEVKEIFFINWWHALTAQGNATLWAVLALLFFLLIIAGMWARRFAKNGSRIPVQAPGLAGFICACFLLLAFVSAGNSRNSDKAVVMENNAPLMNNDLKGKPLALIPEGTTVKLLSDKGQWVEVGLPDGRSGWIDQSQVTKI
jgi:tetratricopeptide (TPR) repeat protein